MSQIQTNLSILIDALKLKKHYLIEIKEYSEHQAKVLAADEFDEDMFKNIMDNKQIRIDRIVEIDDGFPVSYERVRNALAAQPTLYKEQVNQMQLLIKEIGTLAIEIQVIEQRNKNRFDQVSQNSKTKVKEFRTNKKAATNYYNSLNKQTNSDGSHFFDSKK